MKKIIGILLLSALLIGGCARRENPVLQEEPTDPSVRLSEETPSEDLEKDEDGNVEENLLEETEEDAPKEEANEKENLEDSEDESSIKREEENPASQPEAEKKEDNNETSTPAELLETAEEKENESKPVSQPAPAPTPEPQPAPAPAPEPKPEPEPEIIDEPEEIMVILTDGTGKNYKTFMDGVNGTLSFNITRVEHESAAEDVIIQMTTPPGTYKEGTVVKLLVSSGKPAAVVETYAVTYLSDVETELVRLVNEYRVASGVNALEIRADLNKSARYKSRAMIEHDYFSHDNPQDGNVSFGVLMTDVFKYNHYSSFGENLASQFGSIIKGNAEKFFLRWKDSAGHNQNMLNPDWKYMGIGVAYTSKAGSTFKNYAAALATQHFAR